MTIKKVQLYLDRDKTIEASPETSANCVILSDGNDLQKVLDNDLTTPTVVHEETSFKVGVGDVNVSSSVVDGEVGRMVIKGKTYQNILPEPSTPVLTNNKEMFKVNEGLDPNVEVVDGVGKSAILKGNTFVNVLNGLKTDNFIEVINGYTYKRLTSDWRGWNSVPVGSSMLIENKQYIIKTSHSISFTTDETTIKTGSNNAIFTSKSNTFKFKLSNLDDNTIINLMILEYQEGMENLDIPYFEGMQSVKMPVLTTVGKNLADITKLKTVLEEKPKMTEIGDNEYKIVTDGRWNNHGVYWRVKLKAGETIYFKTSVKGISNVRLYDGTGNTYLQKGYTSTDINIYEDVVLSYTASQDMVVMCRYWINDNWIGYIKSPYIAINDSSYEPYKSNILHTPEEVVLRSLPNGVCDTLNLNTGEYVQRIGEVVLDGSQSLVLGGQDSKKVVQFIWASTDVAKNTNDEVKVRANYLSAYVPSEVIDQSIEGICTRRNDNQGLYIALSKTKVATRDINLVKEYLQANPITAYYELATPVVKTVDLSSSGNWEKVVLDGSESITMVQSNRLFQIRKTVVGIPVSNQTGDNPYILTETPSFNTWGLDTYNNYNSSKANSICYHRETFFIQLEKEGSVEEMVSRLQQKPLVIWYQIRTHQDSTQVKQPIFFKDGHIQLSSGADNSLIPTLDYQAKTSNSYVMDLMKTNTKYTMKAKSASGTFTIDGTSYGAGTNGTFTTPSSMTNKFLVMSNKTNEEVMILEGNVVSKTIPYFKGIKSAFEDESKIEVLSTGKNLWDEECEKDVWINKEDGGIFSKSECFVSSLIPIKKGKTYYRDVPEMYYNTYEYDKNGNFIRRIGAIPFTASVDGYFRFCWVSTDVTPTYVIESSTSTTYEPYKSNNTKIPLLSPLRSLPNGVCDELIIDRMKKKVTLIQRVGAIFLNGNEQWSAYPTKEQANTLLFQTRADIAQGKNHSCISDKVPHSSSLWSSGFDSEGVMMGGGGDSLCKRVDLRIAKTKVSSNSPSILQSYLHKNPLTAQYELATPVVTEIDLENFPLVYKDGHVFLNSEIAPVVEIGYNVNQSQQIQANNETLQRHELDILDLDNLIVSFVNAEYNLRLLKFDMELSMMALDE